jgi:hypothetical protein
MDFKKATDELLASITHQELAEALGVSVATVRQARLTPAAKAHRNPPEGWQGAIKRLAKRQSDAFYRLAEKL